MSEPAGPPGGLPAGFAVRVRDDVRLLDGGCTLLGGTPFTRMRLTPAAAGLFDGRVLTVTGERTSRIAERLLAAGLADPQLAATAPVPATDLTVVIPVKDRVDELDRALTSLGRDLAVIVVDDGSAPTVAELIRRTCTRHDAGYHRLPVNRGPAAARNAGLDQVRTPLVAFVDSDVQVTAADLLALARHLHDARVALVAPRVRGLSRRSRPRWHERYDAAASSLDVGPRPGVVRPGSSVPWLPSACLVGRVAPLAGGFDATMLVGEDVDLVWRLHQAGHQVRYDPGVVARHDTPQTVRRWLGRKYVYGTGAAPLALRHPDAVTAAVMTPGVATAAALLLTRRRWAVPFAALLLLPLHRRVRRALPDSGTLATTLTVRSLVWGLRQEAGLLLRHWWPLTLLALPFSRALRRAVLVAWAVDAMAALHDRPDLSLSGATLTRRLDDAAYGAGVWVGCLRARSARALLPRILAGRRP